MGIILEKLIDDTILLLGVDCFVKPITIEITQAHDVHIVDLKNDIFILNTLRSQFLPFDHDFIFNSPLDNLRFKGSEVNQMNDIFYKKFSEQIEFRTYAPHTTGIDPSNGQLYIIPFSDPNVYILEFIRITPVYQRATIEAPERQEPLTRFSNFRIK